MQLTRVGALAFFRHELRQQLRSPATWICFGVMLLLTYHFVSNSQWNDLVGSGRVPVNAPIVMYYIFAFSCYWAAIFATFFMTSPVIRDLRYSVAPIVYAMPFRDRSYLAGKYFAGLLTLLIVMSSAFFGMLLIGWLAPVIGGQEMHTYAGTPWAQGAHAFLLLMVPSCFFFGTVHFALATFTGKMTPSYAFTILVTLVFISFEVTFQGNTQSKMWSEVLDPVGYIALQGQVFYWTAEEQISRYIDVGGTMLVNRALYVGSGLLTLLLVLARADLRGLIERRSKGNVRRKAAAEAASPASGSDPHTLQRLERGGRAFLVSLVLSSGWHEFRKSGREIWFKLAGLFGFLMTLTMALRLGSFYQLPQGALLPTAVDILHQPVETLMIFGMLSVVFACGEVFARERAHRVQALVDASPVSDGVLACSKLVGCAFIALFFTAVPALAALSAQLLKGYGANEWQLYVYTFAFGLLPSLLVYAVIAATVHILVNQRALGHALAIIACWVPIMMEEIKVVEHPLALIGFPRLVPLTGFDALRQFDALLGDLSAYSLGVGTLLLVLSTRLWPRGVETALRERLPGMKSLLRPVPLTLAIASSFAAASGATRVLRTLEANHYESSQEEKAADAEYERRYGTAANTEHPKVVSTKAVIDLSAGDRRLRYEAGLTLRNDSPAPITAIDLQAQPFTRIECFAAGAECIEPERQDEEFDRYRYALRSPLAPGETRTARLNMAATYSGYKAEGVHGTLVGAGTIVDSSLLPSLGYERSRELRSPSERKFHALPKRRPLPPASEAGSVAALSLSPAAGPLPYELRIRVPAGSTALAPGALISRSVREGVAEFRYRTEADSPWYFRILSAPYATSSVEWSDDGANSVHITAYRLPQHGWNAQRILDAARSTLDTLRPVLGDYPHAELRIVETAQILDADPRAHGNLISLPELQAWTHDYRGAVQRDWITYVVAREIARGWWGQAMPVGNVRGAALLTESVPRYLALRVIEAGAGSAAALDLLGVERDSYLRLRTKEQGIEPAAIDVDDENYRAEKGLLSLFVARNVLGPRALDEALGGYFDSAKSRGGPPLANATELLAALTGRAQTSAQHAALHDVFAATTLHDFRVRSAELVDRGGGFRLSLSMDAKRYAVVDITNQTEMTFSAEVPIALYRDSSARPERVVVANLKDGSNALTVDLPYAPARITIDPDGRFIDTNARDNSRALRR
jgi:ABC-2 type transport system permease protein